MTVAASLAALDDAELAALTSEEQAGVGGGSSVVEVAGVPVFVKRIPLTDRELARPGSTANLFGLPVSLQYGIGSPGFNAWRELAANRVVTEGVRSGETTAFPVLHHWRVLPGRSPVAAEHADVDAAVAALGGGRAVRARLEELAAASHSLVLFSEYVPHPLADWLRTDPAGKAGWVEQQLVAMTAFLRGRELLHMDGHFGNLRTDGERIVLTDFGLATSPRFELSPAEREFVRHNAGHDAEYASMRLVNWLVTAVCGVDGAPAVRNAAVRRWAAGGVPDGVPPEVAAVLTRHLAAAARANDLYWRLFQGSSWATE